jgi:poly-gamma-glutamate synthesis protein (capsule biosynthesis protein)
MACLDSGVPLSWIAEGGRPGIRLLERLDDSEFHAIKSQVRALKQEGDIAVASIHWGENWGFDIPRMHQSFAHALIDEAAIDLVHGHSSHHAKGWEVYEEKLILYGCGDFINDYEGIAGNNEYRSDIVAMYLVELSDDAKASLLSMAICPFNIRQFRLRRAKWTDANWLCDTLNRERRSPGWQLSLSSDGMLRLTDAFS